MTDTAGTTPATPEELAEYYGKLVGLVINGEAEKKATYDACVTKILASTRQAYPTTSDKVLGSFAASIAYLLGQMQKVQARDLSEFLEHTFNEYLITAAVLFGGYDPMSDKVPVAPEVAVATGEVPEDLSPLPGNYL